MDIEDNSSFENDVEESKRDGIMISDEISKGTLTNEEIFEMMHLSGSELYVKYISDVSQKYIYLSIIHEHPYLLYFTNGLSNEVLDYLPQFIKNRYIGRMVELINEEEIEDVGNLEKDLKLLNYMFFESHEIGKKIYKTLQEKKEEKSIVR